MEESNVVEINKGKIVLTNGDITLFVNMMTGQHRAFAKITMASIVSGKVQYWIYRVQKKMRSIFNVTEEIRMKLIQKHADKNEDEEMIYIDSHPTIDPEKQQAYDNKVKELMLEPNTQVSEEIKAEFYKKDKKGTVIMSGGTQPKISTENLILFNQDYTELMEVENVLAFERIIITAEVLDKMNSYIQKTFIPTNDEKNPDVIGLQDMFFLEKIFDFTE